MTFPQKCVFYNIIKITKFTKLINFLFSLQRLVSSANVGMVREHYSADGRESPQRTIYTIISPDPMEHGFKYPFVWAALSGRNITFIYFLIALVGAHKKG